MRVATIEQKADKFPPEVAAQRAAAVARKLLSTPPKPRATGKRQLPAAAKPEKPDRAAERS